MRGNKVTSEDIDWADTYFDCIGDDIKKERSRVGGDWIIAGCLIKKLDRDMIKKRLGSDLMIIIINQKNSLRDRLKERHNIIDDETNEQDENWQETVERLTQYSKYIENKSFWEKGVIQIDFEGNEKKEEVMETVYHTINDYFDNKDSRESCKCVTQ